MNRAVVIAVNILRQIRNDKRTVGMIVVTPVLVMVLFGYAFAGEPHDLKLAIANEDVGVASFQTVEGPVITLPLNLGQSMVGSIDSSTFAMTGTDGPDSIRQMITEGEVWGGLYIPRNFTQHFVTRGFQITNQAAVVFGGTLYHLNLTQLGSMPTDQAYMATLVDNSNTQVGSLIQRKIQEAFGSMMAQLPVNLSFSGIIQTSFVYGANAKFVDFFAPGIMSFVITIITIMLTIVSIVRERTNGTMERIFASPTRPHEVVLGYMLAFSLISVLQSCLLLGSAILLFNMTIQGSVLLALGFVVLYAIGVQGLGTLLSTVARNEFQAIQLVPLVFVPFILLGGIFWPVEAMPAFIRPLSSVIPLTYAAEGLRSIVIRGWGPVEIWRDLVALTIFATVMILAGFAVTRKRARG
jgi:ABC-2 type transport system permease protein